MSSPPTPVATAAPRAAPSGHDIDLWEFGILNLVRDAACIVAALGRSHVDLVAGHDYGAGTAAACALIRPDMFRSLALMSAPFGGPPKFLATPLPDPSAELAALDPPRKHYHWYYATRAAAADMDHSPDGLAAFIRAYFHQKSADWSGNDPHPLTAWSAARTGQTARLLRHAAPRHDARSRRFLHAGHRTGVADRWPTSPSTPRNTAAPASRAA